jgi:hypothetical protein
MENVCAVSCKAGSIETLYIDFFCFLFLLCILLSRFTLFLCTSPFYAFFLRFFSILLLGPFHQLRRTLPLRRRIAPLLSPHRIEAAFSRQKIVPVGTRGCWPRKGPASRARAGKGEAAERIGATDAVMATVSPNYLGKREEARESCIARSSLGLLFVCFCCR